MAAAEKPENTDARLIALLEEIRSKPPVIDPTANVLQLVAAAMLRQDDLRKAESNRIDDLLKTREQAQRDLAHAESRRIDALTLAESRRIDALLAANQNAVALASTRAELTASALAERVDATQKTLAAQVDATAKASEAANVATAKALTDRIQPLEQFRFETGGAKTQQVESKSDNRWVIGLAISTPSFLLAVIALVYALTK